MSVLINKTIKSICLSVIIFIAGYNYASAAQVNFTGKTFASNQLIQDTLMTATPVLEHILVNGNGVESNKVNCTSMEYNQVDTKVISPPNSGNWQELWTFHVCERKVALPISFIKNPKGQGYYMAIDMQHYKISPGNSHQ